MRMSFGRSRTGRKRSGRAKTIVEDHELKPKQISGILGSIQAFCTKVVKRAGVLTIPGPCRVKTRVRPATKAGTRIAFGKEFKAKARPAKTVMKAFPVAALKATI